MVEQSINGRTPVVKIYGRLGQSEGYAIRDFLHRCGIPFEWVELTSNQDARAEAGVESVHDSRLPVCVFRDGTRMECPTVR